MPTTLDPLTPTEMRRWLGGIRSAAEFYRRPAQVLTFTGMHPSILSYPVSYDLSAGTDYITWRRTKTGQRMRLPLLGDLEDQSWVGPWVAKLLADPPHHRQYYGRLISDCARVYGLPGMAARTLRHTFIWLLAVDYELHPIDVARYAGCTIEVAYEYARRGKEGAEGKLLEGFRRFRDPPASP